MKKMVKMFGTIIVVFSGLVLYACGGGGGGGDSTTSGSAGTSPQTVTEAQPGAWSGKVIEFFVSNDSSQLTKKDSTILDSDGNPAAIKLGPIKFSGGCSGTVTTWIESNVPISNGTFDYDDGTHRIEGTFASASDSSGSWSFSNNDPSCGNISGSGSWSATPSTASAAEKQPTARAPEKSTRTENIYDPNTGALIGVSQYSYD